MEYWRLHGGAVKLLVYDGDRKVSNVHVETA